jgi:CheY-like chemotaxis protein
MVAKTVLVVEDDPCIRMVAEEMFAAAGEAHVGMAV